MLCQIKVQQFYTDLGLYHHPEVLNKIVEFKDFSRPFQGRFNFQGLSKKAI